MGHDSLTLILASRRHDTGHHRPVVGRAARITAGGIVIGLSVSLLLAPRIGDLLYQIEPRDPLTFLGVAALLIGVAAVASALPAWRATKVDPNVALRTE